MQSSFLYNENIHLCNVSGFSKKEAEMSAAVYARQLQDSASKYIAQARELGGKAYTAAYKYVTVEAPDPTGKYYFQKASGENVELTDETLKGLQIQIDTLERQRTQWKHIANVGFGVGGTVPLTVGQWTEYRLLVAAFAYGIFKGYKAVGQRIDQRFDGKTAPLKQRISDALEVGSGKKAQ
jgi:hypothetical protein